jgi:Na+/H+ antiporter NhaD/arsenite permease-like protein
VITPWAAIPFVLLLLAVAVMPLLARHWWERHYWLVTTLLALPILTGTLFFGAGMSRIVHSLREYFGFIALIGSLYVIAGGIRLRVIHCPTPLFNTLLLFVGAFFANIIGTTGAAMLFIRPFLSNNRHRYAPYLVVFFIFVVANIGGALTPIGDPPLLLGYLNGVPFFWVLARVWPVWLAALAAVLGVFYWLDSRNRPPVCRADRRLSVHIYGYRNLIFLGMILVAVFSHTPVRELIMLAAAVGAYLFTPRSRRRRNAFSFRPIIEVAVLFAGIFITMGPVLELLRDHADRLGLRSVTSFYWITGLLSGVLDNAPTYRTSLEVALGLYRGDLPTLLAGSPELVKAISLGAVFFGATTYIGNGPNFMVKSIAEQRGLRVPHFFEYVFRYSLPILTPVFLVVWLLLLL